MKKKKKVIKQNKGANDAAALQKKMFSHVQVEK